MKPTPTQRGGARKGAGRPEAGTVRQQLRLKPETIRKMKALAAAQGVSLGAVVDGKF